MTREREETEAHLTELKENLGGREREALENEAAAKALRTRVEKLHGRLKERFRRHWEREQARAQEREARLADGYQELDRRHDELESARTGLAEQCRKFNGEMELGRRQLHGEWDRLREEERAVRDRLTREAVESERRLAALEQRELELLGAEAQVRKERERNRRELADARAEASALASRATRQRRQVAAPRPAASAATALKTRPAALPSALARILAATGLGLRTRRPAPLPPSATDDRCTPLLVLGDANDGAARWQAVVAVTPAPDAGVVPAPAVTNFLALADELADQRLWLADACASLLHARAAWEDRQAAAAAELRELAVRLHDRVRAVLDREHQVDEARAAVLADHDEASRLRHELTAWQNRVRAREVSWESERDRLQAEIECRAAQVAEQFEALGRLRQEWADQRRAELESLQAARQGLAAAAGQYQSLCEERGQQASLLQEERRALTAKALAVEQYRQECLTKSADAVSADRRIEKMRKRWEAAQNASAQAAAAEAEALRADLARAQEAARVLQTRFAAVEAEGAAFQARQAEWEQRQVQAAHEESRLRHEVRSLQTRYQRACQAINQMENELERVARAVFDEPAPPTILLPAPPEGVPLLRSDSRAA